MGGSIKAQRLREVLSFHFHDGFLDIRRRSLAPEMGEQKDGHDEEKQSGRTKDDFFGLSAGWGYFVHGVSATLGKNRPTTFCLGGWISTTVKWLRL